MKLIILNGLPGSGKTNWVRRNKKDGDIVLDFDTHRYPPFPVDEKIAETIIFDGLFLTEKNIIDVINVFADNVLQETYIVDEIEIHHWKEDRDACRENDSTRSRHRSAKLTIDRAKFEIPNINNISNGIKIKAGNINIIEETVYKKPKKEELKKKYGNNIVSDSWIVSGETWGWKSDTRYPMDPDPVPKEFEELEKFLDTVYPELSRSEYKEVLGMVKIKEGKVHDYYSNYIENYFIINTDDLADFLEKHNFSYDL